MTNPDTRTLDLAETSRGESGCGCGCGTATGDPAPEAKETPMTERTTRSYQVNGMTCGHCAGSVTTELEALDGVTAVTVDLVAGGTSTVTVTSTRPLEDAQVAAALDEAGDYRLA